MLCYRARNWISLALDGALPPDRTLALSRHLERCAGCRDHERDLKLGRRLVAATAPRLSDKFEWRLQLKLNRTLQEAARQATSPWEAAPVGPGAWWRAAGLATAGGLALVAALTLFVLPDRPVDLGPPAPAGAVGSAPLAAVTPPPSASTAALPRRPAAGPATVTATAGDPTRTPVLGGSRRFLLDGDGQGRSVGLLMPGGSGARPLVEKEAWSGSSLEDLRSIASLREQNRRLRDMLAQSQRHLVLLQAQLDTSRAASPGAAAPDSR